MSIRNFRFFSSSFEEEEFEDEIKEGKVPSSDVLRLFKFEKNVLDGEESSIWFFIILSPYFSRWFFQQLIMIQLYDTTKSSGV